MDHQANKRILLADNSSEYRRSVIGLLKLEGYSVTEAGSVKDAQEKLNHEQFDLVLADLRMENDRNTDDMSGLEIAKLASTSRIPCLIITAFPSVELARIALRSVGAESLAKDLITKSSDPQTVLDSINLTLRTRDPKPNNPEPGKLILALDKRLVWKNGILLKLSKNQYTLLEELYKKDGGVCSYTELILAIYNEQMIGKAASENKRLRNLVERTKKKIEDENTDHEYIEAVSGRGFRLNLYN